MGYIAGNQYKVTLLTSGGTPYRYCKLNGTTSVYSNLAANTTFTFCTRDVNLFVDEIVVTTPNTKPAPAPQISVLEKLENKTSKLLAVAPNPGNDWLQLNFEVEKPAAFFIEMIDQQGRRVLRRDFADLPEGVFSEKLLGLGGLPAGVYQLVLSDWRGGFWLLIVG